MLVLPVRVAFWFTHGVDALYAVKLLPEQLESVGKVAELRAAKGLIAAD